MGRVDAVALRELDDRVQRAHEEEALPACQYALALGGELLASATLGAEEHAQFVAFSIAKSLAAGTIVHLLATEQLRLEDTAATWIPEFRRDGFDGVTVEHLLTHRAGFPNAPMRALEARTREARGERYQQWWLEWPPGEGYRYHPTSAHWVLSDIAFEITGTAFSTLAHERVLTPLGIEGMSLGAPTDEQAAIQAVAMVGGDVPAGLAIGDLFPEAAPEILIEYGDPDVLAVGVPGAGLVATAPSLAGWMSAWLDPASSPWTPEWIDDMTGHIRVTDRDDVTNVAANRTLGFVVAGDDEGKALRELGPTVGPRTFGTSGLGGQVAWADPDTGIAFAFLTSGINHDVVTSWKRGYELSDLAARCAA